MKLSLLSFLAVIKAAKIPRLHKAIRIENPRFVEANDFEDYLGEIRHGWLRTLCLLGIILIPLFFALDYFMIPADRIEAFGLYRGVVTFLILIEYLILRGTSPSRFAPLYGYAFSLGVGIMISKMTQELGGFDSSYYAGLNLVMIAVIVLIPWSFGQAVINALLIIGSYLALNLIFPNPFHYAIVINNVYFLSSSAVIAVAINRVHFRLIRKEFFANSELRAARKEQDTIMDSVDEGLFIIHKFEGHYLIGEHQSESVKSILGDTVFSGLKFTDALARFFPPQKMEELGDYLTMISSKNLDENMIRDLNPLERVATAIIAGINNSSKFLEFGFKKITGARKDPDFLISIKDVTQVVEMERKLRENENRAEQESQMMLSILHMGPALLSDFLESVETELATIDSVLRDDENHRDFPVAVESIFRSVHSLKGNAALLDLKFLAEKANDFEEKMLILRGKQDLSWEDFLPIAYDLAGLQEVYHEMKGLIQRIRLFQDKGGERGSALLALPEAIGRLAGRIAADLGKKVRLVTTDLNFADVPGGYTYTLRDILVQLTRNAMTHGIECPEVRKKSGKDECGTLTLTLKPVGKTFVVNFRDDGSSFDFAAIRAKAVRMFNGLDADVAKWTAAKLIKIIFEPGFTTTEAATLHAGRGMGMDVIKQRVKKSKGTLRVKYEPGRFTEFEFVFPSEFLSRAAAV